MAGILYALGVGPGDPDLLTLRAARVLAEADLILAAASPRNDYSSALEIAKKHIRPEARIRRLEFPMTRERAILKKAWHEAAEITVEALDMDLEAAFLTLGDPLIYSTFGYLMREVKRMRPEARISVIPGISSFQAAAARKAMILCEGGEPLRLISGIAPEKELLDLLKDGEAAVILKVYRNFRAIRSALEKTGRAENCVLASFVGGAEEKFASGGGALESPPPYMSLLLCPRKR